MAESQVSAFDRFNDALRSLDDQLQELREEVDQRRKRFTKDVQTFRDDTETRLRKTDLFKRAKQVRKDLTTGVEKSYSQVLDVVGLASKAEVDKLSKKVSTLSKKLTEISRNGV